MALLLFSRAQADDSANSWMLGRRSRRHYACTPTNDAVSVADEGKNPLLADRAISRVKVISGEAAFKSRLYWWSLPIWK